MNVLITGGLGHIGSRLIRELPLSLDVGNIFILDNMSTQRYASLFNLPEEGRYRFFEGDILDYDIDSLLKNVDIVIHLAAITNAPESFEIKDKVYKVNLDGTRRIALAAAKSKTPMIFFSSTSVYGTQKRLVDEAAKDEDLNPQSPYAETKLHAEKLLCDIGDEHGLQYIIFRFGTIFGPSIGMRFHTAVNRFCWQAVNHQPITVWRTALDQLRPYLDIVDAIRAVTFVIKNEIFDNNIYNVLTLNTTVRHILDTIKKDIPDIEYELVDTQIMNQLSYEVSSSKFKRLGFLFEGDLESGINETIKMIRNMRTL